MTKSAMHQLGRRLRAEGPVAEADLVLLESLINYYDQICQAVVSEIRGILSTDYEYASRPKTTKSIIEKLQREKTMSLKMTQDLAGVRVVADVNRDMQDLIASKLVDHFGQDRATVIDRRANPVSGYRALHVVVSYNSALVEIQIRTRLQQLWANAYERLGDLWGRQIRYGGEPDEPDLLLADNFTRRDAIASILELARILEIHEETALKIVQVEAAIQESELNLLNQSENIEGSIRAALAMALSKPGVLPPDTKVRAKDLADGKLSEEVTKIVLEALTKLGETKRLYFEIKAQNEADLNDAVKLLQAVSALTS